MTLDELAALPARIEALEVGLPARILALERAITGRRSYPVQDQRSAALLWLPDLTERERELLPFLAAGWTNQEIANHLVISERTVRTHVTNVLTKLNTVNRTTVALWALATAQVSMDDAVALMGMQQPHLIVENEV